MESAEVGCDAVCHGIGRPAAKRASRFVNQTAISDTGCMVSACETIPAGSNILEAARDEAAPTDPRPNAEALIKARLELRYFAFFMRSRFSLSPQYIGGESGSWAIPVVAFAPARRTDIFHIHTRRPTRFNSDGSPRFDEDRHICFLHVAIR